MKLESGVFVNTERCWRTHRKLSTKSQARVKSSEAFIPAARATSPVCLQTGTKNTFLSWQSDSLNRQSDRNGGPTQGPLKQSANITQCSIAINLLFGAKLEEQAHNQLSLQQAKQTESSVHCTAPLRCPRTTAKVPYSLNHHSVHYFQQCKHNK